MIQRGLLIACCLILSSCTPKHTPMNLAELQSQDGILLINYEFVFDGSWINSCHLFFNESQTNAITVGKLDARTQVVRVPGGGNVSFGGVQCVAPKGIFNKSRRRILKEPLVINVASGSLTYPGTIVANWDSDGVHLGDILLSKGGSYLNDRGAFLMKTEDRSPAMRGAIQRTYPTLLSRYKLTKTRFENNPELVQP